jgi:hypothetical protein
MLSEGHLHAVGVLVLGGGPGLYVMAVHLLLSGPPYRVQLATAIWHLFTVCWSHLVCELVGELELDSFCFFAAGLLIDGYTFVVSLGFIFEGLSVLDCQFRAIAALLRFPSLLVDEVAHALLRQGHGMAAFDGLLYMVFAGKAHELLAGSLPELYPIVRVVGVKGGGGGGVVEGSVVFGSMIAVLESLVIGGGQFGDAAGRLGILIFGIKDKG